MSTTQHPRATVLTPPGDGGIGIIALTGPGAGAVLARAFRGSSRAAGGIARGAIAHGHIGRGDAVLDEVIVARVGSAGEERFEINCHGGTQAVRAVMRRLEEVGALTVARDKLPAGADCEAPPLAPAAVRSTVVRALPRAQTRLAVRLLLHQQAGALSRDVQAVRDMLEAGRAGEARRALGRLLEAGRLARSLLDPPRVLLAGPANVGKSTLMNALLRRERVIVHHRPGTTRDIVRELVAVRGVPLELTDSAGIRAAPGEVEREAVRRATGLLAQCDVALVLFDVRRGPGWAAEHADELRRAGRAILVGNKVDLAPTAPLHEAPAVLAGAPQVLVSARDGTGIPELEAGCGAPFTAAQVAALERVVRALDGKGAEAAHEELSKHCGRA